MEINNLLIALIVWVSFDPAVAGELKNTHFDASEFLGV